MRGSDELDELGRPSRNWQEWSNRENEKELIYREHSRRSRETKLWRLARIIAFPGRYTPCAVNPFQTRIQQQMVDLW